MEGFDFEGECEGIHDTGKALLIRTPEHGEIWVPQSCIHEDSEVYEKGGTGKLIVKLSFAEEKGWV
jgi:hypothetical protein